MNSSAICPVKKHCLDTSLFGITANIEYAEKAKILGLEVIISQPVASELYFIRNLRSKTTILVHLGLPFTNSSVFIQEFQNFRKSYYEHQKKPKILTIIFKQKIHCELQAY